MKKHSKVNKDRRNLELVFSKKDTTRVKGRRDGAGKYGNTWTVVEGSGHSGGGRYGAGMYYA